MRANGGPVVNIFAQSQKPGWFLMSNPSITQLSQLPGKAVTVGTLGSGSHLATVEILRKAGVNPDTVVFMGGRGGSDVRIQMLASGTVQAANLVPPYNFMAEKMGLRQMLFYGDHFELAQFGLVVHESALEARRPHFKKALRAFLKSHRYTLEHKEETVQWVLKNLKVEKGDAAKTFDVLLKSVRRPASPPTPRSRTPSTRRPKAWPRSETWSITPCSGKSTRNWASVSGTTKKVRRLE
jgi:ABC-type nitrate/sulfonate/bicarbonate transport system substrate-binding protein